MPMQTTDQWGSLLPSGLGNDQQAQQATGAMRQSPWYQDWMKQNNLTGEGDQYGNVKLNDDQQKQLYDLASKNGIGLNNKYDQIDENGQISEAHHKLRNTLLGAGIAGLSLTGLGAAGIGPMAGLFGGAAGAAGGAAGLGGVEAGATSGVMAGLPGAMSALPALSGAAGAAGAGAAGMSTIPWATGGGYLAPSEAAISSGGALGASEAPTALTAAMSGAGGGNSVGAGSVLSKLMDSNKLSDLGKVIGGFTSGEKANRALEGEQAARYDQNMIAAQKARSEDEGQSLRHLAITNYLKNGGYKGGQQPITLNGQTRQLPQLVQAPNGASTAQMAGANSLEGQLTKRLMPGGTYTPMDFSNYGTPGAAERVGNYAGTAISALGALKGLF